jgi:hypothetical protein
MVEKDSKEKLSTLSFFIAARGFYRSQLRFNCWIVFLPTQFVFLSSYGLMTWCNLSLSFTNPMVQIDLVVIVGWNNVSFGLMTWQ